MPQDPFLRAFTAERQAVPETNRETALLISPDAPIQSSSQDILGRTPFAAALAKAITGVSGADSFVIAIHGKWGSGKSSVLNLVIEQLQELDKSKPEEDRNDILRFNPWNFSDQNQLVLQFLKQFRAHLLQSQKATGQKLQNMASLVAEYAEALSPPLELLPYGSYVSAAVKLVARGAKTALGSAREEDVSTAFERISNAALKLRRRTVVVIDDIDRLTAPETRQIFQLVKLTGRFPYVVYVLAFDRTAVADSLVEIGVQSGNEYLEKIVQVGFDLPPVTEPILTQLITKGIEEILKRFEPAYFDQTRFGNLFHGGFRQNFTTLRHVRKFINGLEFAFSIVGRELNGVDIIGLEALRLFNPKTYETIRSNKEIFAGHIDPLTSEKGTAEFTKRTDDVLKGTGELSENLQNLLLELFPKLSFAYGDRNYGHESETNWEKTHRVATTRYFDAYFQLSLGPGEVSVAEISELIRQSGDENKVLALFREFTTKGKIKHAMESLRFRLSDVPGLNLSNLLSALVQLGDSASENGSPFAGIISEHQHVSWVIFDALDKLEPKARPGMLLTIAKTRFAPKTLLSLLTLIPQLTSEKGMYKEFTEERLAEIRAALVKSIEDAADQDRISVRNDSLPAIMHVWTTWGNKENARLYIRRVARSDDQILDLVNRYIYQVNSYGGGERVGRTQHKLAMRGLASILNLDDLYRRLQNINQEKLETEQREILKIALHQFARMHDKSLTPEQFDNSRFFEDD